MKSNIQINIILSSILVLILVGFGLSSNLIFAESDENTGEIEEPVYEDAGVEDRGGELENNESEDDENIIITGDAEVVVEVENVVNTNILDSKEEAILEDDETIEEETTEFEEEEVEGKLEEYGEGEEFFEEENTEEENNENGERCLGESFCEEEPIIEIVAENEAELENEVVGVASSGSNEIEAEDGDAIIDTGDVNIYVGVINIVNSNVVGSSLSQLLFNVFNSAQGNIDVSDEIGSNGGDGSSINIVDSNTGVIDNEVSINASSGNNEANTQNGDAVITTGDANVVANIFNILNSNIIGSNWTQLIINIFGNWVGDLILPSEYEMQFTSQESGCGSTDITASNTGIINNNVEIQTNTGNNEASGGDSTILTGEANSEVDVLNIANSNVNDNWFFLAVNNFGNWGGQVFSLPVGFGLVEGSNGLEIYNVNLNNNEVGGNNSLNLVSNNFGDIENGVVINVSTGGNSASSGNGSAQITTGDANAVTNLINVLNSNITGTSALLGMINVFGTWEGNIAFGQPDLWIGESAESDNSPVEVDDPIVYTLTYINKGNADATGVVLTDDFNENYLNIIDTGGGVLIDNPGEIQWDLGTIPAGSYGFVSYTAKATDNLPYGITSLQNTSEIDSFENDADDGDNVEKFSLNAINRERDPNPILSYPSLPKLEVIKISSVDEFVLTDNFVDYAIFITNNSDSPAYNVVVNDILYNESGDVLNEQNWDLDHVFAYETIRIDYSIYLSSQIEPGFYTNTAKANGSYIWGDPITSNETSVTIEVRMNENPIEEEMLGETGEGEISSESEDTLIFEEQQQEEQEQQGEILELNNFIGQVGINLLSGEMNIPKMPEQESLAYKISLIEDKNEDENETKDKFFLASVGEFFSSFSLTEILILLLVIAIIGFVLFIDRKRKMRA